MLNDVKIFAGRHSKELANKIANSYGIELGKVVISSFSDGEFQPSFEETVREKSFYNSVNTSPI